MSMRLYTTVRSLCALETQRSWICPQFLGKRLAGSEILSFQAPQAKKKFARY